MTEDQPEPYDHLRAGEDAPVESGVYRVVGVDEDRVTLLELTDERGRRRATGRLERVPHGALDGFEPASDPDRRPARRLRNAVDGTIQWVLMVVRWLRP